MNVKVLKQLRKTAKELYTIEYDIDEHRRPSYVVGVSRKFPTARMKSKKSYFGFLEDALEELKKRRRDYILRDLDRLREAKITKQQHLLDL